MQKDWAEPVGILRAVEDIIAMSLMMLLGFSGCECRHVEKPPSGGDDATGGAGGDDAEGAAAGPVCKPIKECNRFDPPQSCSCLLNQVVVSDCETALFAEPIEIDGLGLRAAARLTTVPRWCLALLAVSVAVGCGGVRIVDDDGPVGGVAGAPPLDGGAGGVAPLGGSGGEAPAGGGGYGGACQDGFIELAGPSGARLESVCDWGKELTDRPVGYFFTIGPEAGGDLNIQGCAEPGFENGLFLVLAESPGSGLNGYARYHEGGVIWETVPDGFSATIEPFEPKAGTTMVGTYAVTVSNGTDTLELAGDFRVCRVIDGGAP